MDNETTITVEAGRAPGIEVTQQIPIRRVADILCTAIESGSSYWVHVADVEQGANDSAPWEQEYTPSYIRAPFSANGWVEIIDTESGDNGRYLLDRAALERGLKVMAEKYPRHWADFIAENEDATTGDVFLQCALFGEVVYG